MAEGFYNKRFGGQFAISAGLVDSSKKYNGHPRPDVIEAMKEVGIDISGQQIRKLDEKMLEMAERVIVLCDKKTCPGFLLKRKNVTYVNVDDPPDEEKTIGVIRTMRNKIGLVVRNLE